MYNLLSYFRVHLSKRRVRGGAGGVQSAVSQLVVKHRELDDNERKAQVRITLLCTEIWISLFVTAVVASRLAGIWKFYKSGNDGVKNGVAT